MTEMPPSLSPTEAPEQPDYSAELFTQLSFHKSWLEAKYLHEANGNEDDAQRAFLEDYIERTGRVIEMAVDQEIDTIIFLDKSARPVSWLMGEVWDDMTKHRDPQPTMPERRFLNVDRLPWRIDPDVEITTHPDNRRKPTKEELEGLRVIFQDNDGNSTLEGKRVLIVDEVSDSGDTLYVAKALLEEAFPDSEFKTTHFMDVSKRAADGSKKVLDVPVWYKSDRDEGRGVYGPVDPDDELRRNKLKRLTRESHQFLATRPIRPVVGEDGNVRYERNDPDSVVMHREIGLIALFLAHGELLPAPVASAEESFMGQPIDEYAQKIIERRNAHRSVANRGVV